MGALTQSPAVGTAVQTRGPANASLIFTPEPAAYIRVAGTRNVAVPAVVGMLSEIVSEPLPVRQVPLRIPSRPNVPAPVTAWPFTIPAQVIWPVSPWLVKADSRDVVLRPGVMETGHEPRHDAMLPAPAAAGDAGPTTATMNADTIRSALFTALTPFPTQVFRARTLPPRGTGRAECRPLHFRPCQT
jgi:hypothetical protein